MLLVNLSFLSAKPTGISIYATNLCPYLQHLEPTLLIALTPALSANTYTIPANLNPDFGTKGHFRRLMWTQVQLPKISKKLSSQLLFSPIPEAPLYSKCRYIVTVHDLIPLRFPKRRSPLTPYFRYYIPQVLLQAEHIICNSAATAHDIVNYFHISARKITPILLAYDANRFDHLNLPIRNYFLYIGRHDPHKNLQRVITAFAQLAHSHDYELWLAGPPDARYTPSLRALAVELGVDAQVKFLDYVAEADLASVINQAIALVFPSLWEGFGLPVLEAMACGTPVITSNISSLPEVAGDAALLVNPYNTQEITTAMDAIARNPQLRSHLSTLSLTRAHFFSWAKTGEATAEILSGYL